MSDDAAIRFQAQIFKIGTLIDGGLRLTLDLSAADSSVIVALFDAKQPGVLLEVAAVAVDTSKKTLTDLDDEAKQTTKGNDSSMGGGRRSIRRNEQAGGGV